MMEQVLLRRVVWDIFNIKDFRYMQVLTYLIFGALTTMVNIIIYFIFSKIIGLDYLISNAIAWFLSVMFAYITNKIYVFKSMGWGFTEFIKEITTFISCRLLSGGMDMVIMYIFIDLFSLNDLIIKLFSNLCVIVVNFLVSKNYIFQKRMIDVE